MGVHSAGARLSSHGPGGCKSRYLHLSAPSKRAVVKPLPKGLGVVSKAPFQKGPPLLYLNRRFASSLRPIESYERLANEIVNRL
jgi:hypothetical protein